MNGMKVILSKEINTVKYQRDKMKENIIFQMETIILVNGLEARNTGRVFIVGKNKVLNMKEISNMIYLMEKDSC